MLPRVVSGQAEAGQAEARAAEARVVEVAAGTTMDTGGTVVGTPDAARTTVVAGTTETWPAVAAWVG
jgi:hypothetical protein